MLTACQIGLSCRYQLFLFLSEPEFIPRLLSATPERERDERIVKEGERIFCSVKTIVRD